MAHKSELNIYCQGRKIAVSPYDTRQESGGYVSTLRCENVLYRSKGAHKSKKDAENDVASIALQSLRTTWDRDAAGYDSKKSAVADSQPRGDEGTTTKSDIDPRSGEKSRSISPAPLTTPEKCLPFTAVPSDIQQLTETEQVLYQLRRLSLEHTGHEPCHTINKLPNGFYKASVAVGPRVFHAEGMFGLAAEAKHHANKTALMQLHTLQLQYMLSARAQPHPVGYPQRLTTPMQFASSGPVVQPFHNQQSMVTPPLTSQVPALAAHFPNATTSNSVQPVPSHQNGNETKAQKNGNQYKSGAIGKVPRLTVKRQASFEKPPRFQTQVPLRAPAYYSGSESNGDVPQQAGNGNKKKESERPVTEGQAPVVSGGLQHRGLSGQGSQPTNSQNDTSPCPSASVNLPESRPVKAEPHPPKAELNYKQMLHEFTQKSKFDPPVYTTEDSQECVGFVGVVTVNGVTYKSQSSCNKKKAHISAAAVALKELGLLPDEREMIVNDVKKLFISSRSSSLPEGAISASPMSYKNKLQEHHQKHKLSLPSYSIEQKGAMFVGTVEFHHHGNRIQCKGEKSSTKKSAEQSAAYKACIMLSIQ